MLFLHAMCQLPRMSALNLAICCATTALTRPWCCPLSVPLPASHYIPGRLALGGHSLSAPLPDIRPGALPSLARLELVFPGLHTTLPPSWGADPAVLPNLRELRVHVRLEGSLPASWALGFRHLSTLDIDCGASQTPGMMPFTRFTTHNKTWQAVAQHDADGSGGNTAPAQLHGLPAEWGSPSGFPRLTDLRLVSLPVAGALPRSWADGGFPLLLSL